MNAVVNCSCTDLLAAKLPPVQSIFADPPDNLGLGYGTYKDKIPADQYYGWIESWLLASVRLAPIVWISYYWAHDIELKYMIRNIIKYRHPLYAAKTFLWRYTFGQHSESDCGSGFRYLVRLMRRGTIIYPDAIRVESERQRLGDARANPDGRVPDDVWDAPEIWDVPRVTGNSRERRSWHPTQHPERLMERAILLCTRPGDQIVDLFAGTGTTLRVSTRLGRECITCDIDSDYAQRIAHENTVPYLTAPPGLS